MTDIAARIDLDHGDTVVLFGFSTPGPDRGAIARLRDGRRLWTARPPEGVGQDAFVSMDFCDGDVVADSFQGLRLSIDPDTGRVRGRAFVK